MNDRPVIVLAMSPVPCAEALIVEFGGCRRDHC
jgi:hypothetical protein